jgi:muconolactone delta-isomerase
MPLFLVRCQLEVEGSPEVFEAFVKTCELCSGLQSSGKVKNFGAFADMSGGAVIVEAESEEEVRRFVESMPVKPFVRTEIKRLLSPEELKSIASSAKPR